VPKKIPRKVSHQVCEEEYGYSPHGHGFGNGHGGFGGFGGFDGGLIGKRSDTEDTISRRRSDTTSGDTSTKSNLVEPQPDQ